MVICLQRGADLHVAQLMPLLLTVSCFSKIQIGFTFLVPAHLGSPGQKAVKCVCVCMCYMQNRLRWHGQVLQKEDDNWVKKWMEYGVDGSRPRGRPKRTWREVVEKDGRARKLNEDAMDSTCSRWRKLMKLSDDQDGCEWMKVSSGTGQPGQSRTESR